jgi:putative hydrolase of the HAD superfamily
MSLDIKAIFLDLGDTLRFLQKDDAFQAHARNEIARLVGTDEDPVAFCQKLDERYKTYRVWAFENLREAPEAELWTRWMVPEFPAERIAPVGAELTYLFRQSKGRRVVVEGGRQVLEELGKRGYTLGIISNLIGTREIPEWLEKEDFGRYFKSVVLSSVLGIRKPSPTIYHEAARKAGVEPGKCAYIGDNLNRDVTGTRLAGFGMIVIMTTPEKLAETPVNAENRPDRIIYRFQELLEVFPGRMGTTPG